MASHSSAALGEIIRQQRELAELSMRQFAEAVGISNPYLSQIERGLRAPSEQVLEGIARALRTSADVLYERAGLRPPGERAEGSAVLEAIAADPLLSARQRSALREVYEAFIATSPQGRAAGAARSGGRTAGAGGRAAGAGGRTASAEPSRAARRGAKAARARGTGART